MARRAHRLLVGALALVLVRPWSTPEPGGRALLISRSAYGSTAVDCPDADAAGAAASKKIASKQRRAQYRAKQKRAPGGGDATTVAARVDSVLARVAPPPRLGGLADAYSEPLQAAIARAAIDWGAVPAAAWPRRGAAGAYAGTNLTKKGVYKMLQVEAFAAVLAALELEAGARVVDCGSGQGGLALPLAALLPRCEVVGVDVDAELAARLGARAADARLANCRSWTGDIARFDEAFDVAVALHACGPATDLCIVQAVRRRAIWIVCPCCLGKVAQNAAGGGGGDGWNNGRHWVDAARARAPAAPAARRPPPLRLPRSDWLRGQMSRAGFVAVCRTAEHVDAQGAAAKTVMELDRVEAAAQDGYVAHLVRMPHLARRADFAHQPHNQLIIGYPRPQPGEPDVAQRVIDFYGAAPSSTAQRRGGVAGEDQTQT